MKSRLIESRTGGILFTVLGFLILLIGAGIFLLQRASQQSYKDAHRFSHGEIALQLAQSGINMGWERIFSISENPDTAFARNILNSSASDRVIPMGSSESLSDLLGLFEGDATLTVAIKLSESSPLIPGGSYSGIRLNSSEKRGRMTVVAAASYRGTRKVLKSRRRFSVCAPTLPVLSKFTLFVQKRNGQEPNFLAYDHLKPEMAFKVNGKPAAPLVLYHTDEQIPAVVNGKLADIGSVLDGFVPDRGGLVYLGGDPWELNLVHGSGAGPYEELHLLRRQRHLIRSSLPGTHTETVVHSGFYRGVSSSSFLGSFGRSGGILSSDESLVIPEETSALHLTGDLAWVSPTIVFGPVTRRFLRAHVVDNRTFVAKKQEEEIPADYPGTQAQFRGTMPQVVCQPYNRTWDYLRSNFESTEEQDLEETRLGAVTPPTSLMPKFLTRVQPAQKRGSRFCVS